MSDELNELQAQIALGFDVEKFAESTVGRYFSLRAQNDVLDALERLKVVDPFDAKAIQAEQNAIRVCENFFVWMNDAITEGRSAGKALEDASTDPVDPV